MDRQKHVNIMILKTDYRAEKKRKKNPKKKKKLV